MNIKAVIQAALVAAFAVPRNESQIQKKHSARSKCFVKNLATALRTEYESQPVVRVFSKDSGKNRSDFGLNELLFDVLVCETGWTKSASGATDLAFVTKGLWAIESEMARDSREAIFDFNKLVLASSDNLLFIGPQVSDEAAFIKALLRPASFCRGEVYVGLVPHPDQWDVVEPSIRLWHFVANNWVQE